MSSGDIVLMEPPLIVFKVAIVLGGYWLKNEADIYSSLLQGCQVVKQTMQNSIYALTKVSKLMLVSSVW